MTDNIKRQLPQDIEQMKACLGQLLTEQSIDKALEFKAKPQDVFVVTYPKSGTTWMQQIVHGVRSGGSMDFDEICQVVPWIEACAELGQDLEQPQQGDKRLYKTHFSYERVPKHAKYIFVVRDPKDVLPSFYHFFEGFMFEPGTVSLEQFFHEFFLQGTKSGRYWEHLLSWWPHKDSENTLFLTFEKLKQDLAGSVAKVADFLEVELTDEVMAKVVEQSSFQFMNAHNSQFDDHYLLNARRDVCKLPLDATTSKVRSGKSGGDKGLTPEILQQLDEYWQKIITTELGFEDYASLRQAIDES